MGTMTHGTAWSGSNTQTTQEKTYTFSTAETYVDKNISFKVTAQSGTLGSTGGAVSGNSNITLSTTNTSGISVTGSGKGNVTSAGWIGTGAATTASSQTKYVTGVTVGAGKSFQINDGIYTWTYSVDASGNVTIT